MANHFFSRRRSAVTLRRRSPIAWLRGRLACARPDRHPRDRGEVDTIHPRMTRREIRALSKRIIRDLEKGQ